MSTDRPEPGLGEILVRVRAARVNPVDRRTRSDGGLGTLGRPPFVLGWDVAGTVEATGLGVTLFKPGDRVMGMPRFPHEAGAYAEFVTGLPGTSCTLPNGSATSRRRRCHWLA
ncbi:alcohol dehydrogenase catalytic domain-containing protein [Streptomyces kaempferi]